MLQVYPQVKEREREKEDWMEAFKIAVQFEEGSMGPYEGHEPISAMKKLVLQ